METAKGISDYFFKVLMVGDTKAGKSAILDRFVDNKFANTYISTIGTSFKVKKINSDGKNVRLQIWDTAGQERYRSIISAYYRNSNVYLTVVGFQQDETAQAFTERAKAEFSGWCTDIRKYGDNAPVLFVINKADLISQADRASIQRELLAYTKQNNVHNKIFFVSANTGEGIEELFVEASRVALQQTGEQECSEVVKQKSSKIGSFFKVLWNGVSSLFSAVIGGIFISIAMLFIANPLSLTYHFLANSKNLWWEKPFFIFSPLATVALIAYYGFLGAIYGWQHGIMQNFAGFARQLEQDHYKVKHVLASLLVLGITAAVVLAVIFPPAGLAWWLPTMAATVGLSGVSTAVLAVIAGVATIAIGSLVYGLANLTFSGEKVKGQSAAKSMKMDDDQEQLLSKGATAIAVPMPNPAADVVGSPAAYQSVLRASKPVTHSSDAQPPVSGQAPTLAKGSE